MLPTAAFARPAPRNPLLDRLHPATKLCGLLLATVTCLVLPAWALVPAAVLVTGALMLVGARPGDLLGACRSWWPVIALVLAIHTLTTVEAAPLGHPSRVGFLRGLVALARVGVTVACVALYLRASSWRDITVGVEWWLTPLRRLGVDTTRTSLVMAVALGAVPLVMAEGRRVETTLRLRRGGRAGTGGGPARWLLGVRDRARLAVPLIEGLFRRAEGLTLSLQDRLPRAGAGVGRPALAEFLALALWLAGLILWWS